MVVTVVRYTLDVTGIVIILIPSKINSMPLVGSPPQTGYLVQLSVSHGTGGINQFIRPRPRPASLCLNGFLLMLDLT
jgi:hypothetical protein